MEHVCTQLISIFLWRHIELVESVILIRQNLSYSQQRIAIFILNFVILINRIVPKYIGNYGGFWETSGL